MARGYPDFFGQSIFLKYGQMQHVNITAVNCPAGETTDIVSITGKGKTYSGWAYASVGVACLDSVKILAVIDGSIYEVCNHFECDYVYNATRITNALIQQTYYSAGDGYVAYAFAKDWTFEQSLKIQIENDCGVAAIFNGDFHWAQVV